MPFAEADRWAECQLTPSLRERRWPLRVDPDSVPLIRTPTNSWLISGALTAIPATFRTDSPTMRPTRVLFSLPCWPLASPPAGNRTAAWVGLQPEGELLDLRTDTFLRWRWSMWTRSVRMNEAACFSAPPLTRSWIDVGLFLPSPPQSNGGGLGDNPMCDSVNFPLQWAFLWSQLRPIPSGGAIGDTISIDSAYFAPDIPETIPGNP